MSAPDFAAVIAAIAGLKEMFGVTTDQELAALLGVERTAVAQWKFRARIPSHVLEMLEAPEEAFFHALERVERELRLAAQLSPDTVTRFILDKAADKAGSAAQGQVDQLLDMIVRGC